MYLTNRAIDIFLGVWMCLCVFVEYFVWVKSLAELARLRTFFESVFAAVVFFSLHSFPFAYSYTICYHLCAVFFLLLLSFCLRFALLLLRIYSLVYDVECCCIYFSFILSISFRSVFFLFIPLVFIYFYSFSYHFWSSRCDFGFVILVILCVNFWLRSTWVNQFVVCMI